jgi:hypothetical protein
MEAPLDQEAAIADLVTDIVAPALHRSLPDAELCDLIHDLASRSSTWRDAWSISDPPAASDPPAVRARPAV